MAKLIERPTVEMSASLVLNEAELRMLAALASYGDASVTTALEKLSSRFSPEGDFHDGLSSLITAIGLYVPPILRRVDAARDVFNRKDLKNV